MGDIINFPKKPENNKEQLEKILIDTNFLDEIKNNLEANENLGEWLADAISEKLEYEILMKQREKALREWEN